MKLKILIVSYLMSISNCLIQIQNSRKPTEFFIPGKVSVKGTGRCNGFLGLNIFLETKTSFSQYAVAIFFPSARAYKSIVEPSTMYVYKTC